MSSLTIDSLPDELIAMATTPEGMARARAAILEAFGLEPEPIKVSTELYDSLMERLDRIESGELKEIPWAGDAVFSIFASRDGHQIASCDAAKGAASTQPPAPVLVPVK